MPAPPEHDEPGDGAAALIDAAGTILDINATAAAIIERPGANPLGSSIWEHINRDDRELASRLLDQAITDGSAGPVELRILVPSGGWIWLRCVGVREGMDPPTVRITLASASEARRLADQLERTTQDLEREHAELMHRSEAMADLAGLITGADDVGYLIRGISGVALRHLAPLAAVLLVDGDGMRVMHLAHVDAEAEALLRESLATVEGDVFSIEGAISDAIEAGEPQVNFDGPFHPQLPVLLAEFNDRFKVGARAVFPMRTRQQWIGALIVARSAGDPDFSDADIDLARLLAGRAALAVDAARSEAMRRDAEALSRRRATQQAAIAELGSLALAGLPVDELAEACREKVCAALDATHCGVVLSDLPLDDPALRDALDDAGSLVIPDLAAEPPFRLPAELAPSGLRTVALCRIVASSGPVGLLSVGTSAPNSYGPDETVFLAAMANVMASAVDARRSMERLRRMALHDTLTGLPNRDLVLPALDRALAARSDGTEVAVLICDVDRFKVVNDALGHAAGDDVLKAVAQRLVESVRPGDTVGRFGGDEFVVVCPDVAQVDAVVTIAERLATTFASPLVVEGTEVVATASIGIAISDGTGERGASDLLRDADAAMYRAKENGRARFEIYDDGMRERASRRLRTETDLRAAFDRGELELHFQPVVSLRDGRLLGVEALARWARGAHGVVPPEEFVGVALECGLASELAEWALAAAATHAVRWADRPDGPEWVAVNLAAQQLTDHRLLERIDDVLARTGVDPSRLRIEVTEDALVEDTDQAARVLDAIRARGLSISIDDFGTGYSSLTYLRRLPVNSLKLDGGFVQKLGDDEDDMVIAAAVVVMAGALGLDVVAECVETAAQMRVLRAMGCDQVQGFAVSPPLPADELEEWMDADPAWVSALDS